MRSDTRENYLFELCPVHFTCVSSNVFLALRRTSRCGDSSNPLSNYSRDGFWQRRVSALGESQKEVTRVLSAVGGKPRYVFRLITLYKTVKEVPRRVRRDRRPVSPRGTKVLNEWMNERPPNGWMNEASRSLARQHDAREMTDEREMVTEEEKERAWRDKCL